MQYLRDALRALRATPLVTTVALLSLALGIGANTAIFSIVDSLLLRTLPVRQPERLVQLSSENEGTSWTNPIWEQIRDRPRLFDGALAYSSTRFDLAIGGEAELAQGLWASGDFFQVLGVPAILGRTFTPADDRRGGGPDGPVAVISYGFWHRHFGGAADVIGRPITLNRVSFTIIGVTPPAFFGPEVGQSFDVAVPLGQERLVNGAQSMLDNRSTWWLSVMARLKPDQTLGAAAAALRGVQPQIREATLPQDWPPQALAQYVTSPLTLVPAATGESSLRARYQRPLTAIMAVVVLVLLIACANIANLLLARAAARRHELSVRQALGASRWRLAAQLLTESLMLSGAGALLGLAFAQWGSRLLVYQLTPQRTAVFLDLSLDWRVLGFTAAAAVGTALLFGTVPALGATRVQPVEAMREQGRGISGGHSRLASGLVVGQVTLSLILVVAAGLFVRTFASLANRDLGFQRSGVLLVRVDAQRSAVPPEERTGLYQRIREAVAAQPGVRQVAASEITPVAGWAWHIPVEVVGAPPSPERERSVFGNMVSPGWFAVYRTPLPAGRDFDRGDQANTPHVAIVNQEFVRRFFHGANPLVQTIRWSQPGNQTSPPIEIVGVVADAVYRALRAPAPPTLYVPVTQSPMPPGAPMTFSVRSAAGPPALLTRGIAQAIVGVDRDLSITFRLLEDQVSDALTQERLVALLSGFFGALALLLAGLGLYGVTAYAVNRRRPEMGIRMALGADPEGVVRLVLRRVAWVIGLGLTIGGLATWWAARLAGSLLYGVDPRDPITFAGAAVVLIAIAALAGWLPARRAARIDPVEALREGAL
jgi:predicted permease